MRYCVVPRDKKCRCMQERNGASPMCHSCSQILQVTLKGHMYIIYNPRNSLRHDASEDCRKQCYSKARSNAMRAAMHRESIGTLA